jgi:PIN domain nuclease of toxin-antitoxin system
MNSVIIDTHIFIWYITNPNKLAYQASSALRQAVNNGYPIYLSTISIVEICYLTEKAKISPIVLENIKAEMNEINAGVKIIPLSPEISLTLQQIPRQTVPEMGDRIIAATALYLGLPLVTKDHKIRELSIIQTIWDSSSPNA